MFLFFFLKYNNIGSIEDCVLILNSLFNDLNKDKVEYAQIKKDGIYISQFKQDGSISLNLKF